VKLVEASAFLGLTLPVVRYRVHGIIAILQAKIVTPIALLQGLTHRNCQPNFSRPLLSVFCANWLQMEKSPLNKLNWHLKFQWHRSDRGS
jgi:hypothetical protein